MTDFHHKITIRGVTVETTTSVADGLISTTVCSTKHHAGTPTARDFELLGSLDIGDEKNLGRILDRLSDLAKREAEEQRD